MRLIDVTSTPSYSRRSSRGCAARRQKQRDRDLDRYAPFLKQYKDFLGKRVGFFCAGFCQKIVVYGFPL